MNNTPYEEGDPQSRICILAEAPSRSEMREGRPLVGPSGQVLEQCMHSARMIRRDCYITNCFDYQVRKSKDGTITNDSGDILWHHKKGWTELGFKESLPCLERLQACGANVIVPLGATAMSMLTSEISIMKWRGSIMASSLLDGRKVVPTVHPAATLRGKYIWRHLLTSDLYKAYEESDDPALNLLERDLIIDPIFPEVIDYLKQVLAAERSGFDIEVLNHQVSCLSFALSPTSCMSIPFVIDGGKHRWSEDDEGEIWHLIAQILANEQHTLIIQNSVFDWGFMLQQMGMNVRCRVEDTMIAHHIMYPDFPKGLDFLCSMHTREPYYKDDKKLWSKPWLDLEAFWKYNAKDSATIVEIWDVLEPLLKEQGHWQTYRETIDLIPSLLYMQIRGFKVDLDRLAQKQRDIAEQLEQEYATLREVADYEFNPLSPKQCIEYFYIHKSLNPYTNRKTGKPTTDDKAMSRIVRRYNLKEARSVQAIRALEKLKGTYLDVKLDKDNRVRCSYNPRGTNTGRLSSSQTIFGTGMNLQNLHPAFKGFLVADE